MSDLPRVEYIDPEKVTEEDIKRAEEKSKKISERTKSKGLGVSLSSQIGQQNKSGFLQKIKKGR